VTCGIYGLYTIYRISNDVKELTGDQSISPGVELVLCIVTCGIYSIYWSYKYAHLIFMYENQAGMPFPSDLSVACLVVTLVGLIIVSMALMQNELNKIWVHLDTHPQGGANSGFAM